MRLVELLLGRDRYAVPEASVVEVASRVAVAPQKKTARRPEVASLGPGTVAALEASNRLDCDLYRFAVANFEGRIDGS